MYGKVFASMYDGSLYGQWEAIVTFQQMIVLADAEGFVDMTPQAIAARTSIPLDIISKGIELLSKPDLYSRSPDCDGKRIELVDESRPWGWLIVNYAKYSKIVSAEGKREADRLRIAAKRKLERELASGLRGNNGADVAECRAESQSVANVAHGDGDGDGDGDGRKKTSVGLKPDRSVSSEAVARIFEHWKTTHSHPKAQLDKDRRALIRKRLENYSEDDLCQAISGYLNSPHHMGQNAQGKKYDEIEVFLRDAKHVDAGLKAAAEPKQGGVRWM